MEVDHLDSGEHYRAGFPCRLLGSHSIPFIDRHLFDSWEEYPIAGGSVFAYYSCTLIPLLFLFLNPQVCIVFLTSYQSLRGDIFALTTQQRNQTTRTKNFPYGTTDGRTSSAVYKYRSLSRGS